MLTSSSISLCPFNLFLLQINYFASFLYCFFVFDSLNLQLFIVLSDRSTFSLVVVLDFADYTQNLLALFV